MRARAALLAVLLAAPWPGPLRAGEPAGLPADTLRALARAKVTCSTLELKFDEGSEYYLTCLLPPALRPLLAGVEVARLVTAPLTPDARYAAYAALHALERFHLLPGPERMRFALELAAREHEPFASARIELAFGEPAAVKTGLARLANTGRLNGPRLGFLPAPFTRDMTGVLRERLGPGKPSTLACYLAQLMGDSLGPEAAQELRQVVARAPGSFEARLAKEALLNLEQAARFSEGPFDFATRLGLVTRWKNGCNVLALTGPGPRVGTTVQLVRLGPPEALARAEVSDNPACFEQPEEPRDEAAGGSAVVLALGDVVLGPGEVAIGIVAPPAPLAVAGGAASADLDGDGQPERFRACTSAEGVHLTAWSGAPLEGPRRWHAYRTLGYDVEPTCVEADWRP
jgi:hypothetical protein